MPFHDLLIRLVIHSVTLRATDARLLIEYTPHRPIQLSVPDASLLAMRGSPNR